MASGNVLSASEYDWVHTGGNTSGTQVNNSAQNDSSIQLLKNKDHAGIGGNSNANKGYCHGNLIKYQHRHGYKNKPVEDMEKAEWYLRKMLEVMKEIHK